MWKIICFAADHHYKIRLFFIIVSFIIAKAAAAANHKCIHFTERMNVNPPTTEVMGFPPLLWVAAF